MHKHSDKYLTRTDNNNTVQFESLDTTLVALMQFPSLTAFESCAENVDYAPFAEARKRGSVSRFHVLDSTDVAGIISYLVGARNVNLV